MQEAERRPERAGANISEAVSEARIRFPRGLIQPPGSFRFSADALLLADFLSLGEGGRLLDLGTGCGVVALAVLLAHGEVTAVGVERNAALAEAARHNAVRLGLEKRFQVVREDIANLGEDVGLFDLVLANPPFRQAARGRVPANPLRREALFEEANTLDIFCAAAAKALAPGGRFGLIFPAEREGELIGKLAQNGLRAERMQPVITREGKAPKRILAQAGRG
jgi:tRNA1(Val) A37 N6-methylase TrmN6